MTKSIRISVIMPVYNVRSFLCEAIDSVQRQTFREWELILIDDGSTDGCSEICDTYAQRDQRIRVFHTANNGVDAARNLGISEACGEWLLFMDSDDLLEEKALETLYAHTEGVNAVIAGYREIPSGRRYQAVHMPERTERLAASADKYIQYDRSFVLNPLHAKLYRKTALTHRFREDRPFADDTFFNMDNLFDIEGIAWIPDILYVYRRREDSGALHHTQTGRLETSFSLMNAALARFPESEELRRYLTGKFVIRVWNYILRCIRGKEDPLTAIASVLQKPLFQDTAVQEAEASLPELEAFMEAVKRSDAEQVYRCASAQDAEAIRADRPGLISVVLPVYNMEDTLERAVRSILQQTYVHWELIIVDDGSTDSSGEIADMYAQKDCRIRILHRKNAGVSAARNAGVACAAGEWLAFIDGDDEYVSEAFSVMMRYSAGTDMVGGSHLLMPENKLCRTDRDPLVFDRMPQGYALEWFYKAWTLSVCWDKLYRRALIHDPFEPGQPYAEDAVFNLRNFRYLKQIVLIPEVCYIYHHERSRRDIGMLEGSRYHLEQTVKLYPDNQVLLRRAFVGFIRDARKYILNIVDDHDKPDAEKEEGYARCREMIDLPEELCDEGSLFPVNRIWWEQLKAGQYEEAVAGLRLILEEQRRARNVLYQDGGSADPR